MALLNPFRPEVQQPITELVVEIVVGSGADGIQVDDHMSLPSARHRPQCPGRSPGPGLAEVARRPAHRLLVRLHQAVNAQRPDALVSASPDYHDFAYKRQLQNWRDWVRRGIVDELLVQLYRRDLESFTAELQRPGLTESLRRIPVATGISTGLRTRPVPIALVTARAEAARARDLGMAFFSFETLWQCSDEPPALRQEALGRLFPTPAPRNSGLHPLAPPATAQPGRSVRLEHTRQPGWEPNNNRTADSLCSIILKLSMEKTELSGRTLSPQGALLCPA